MDEFFEYSLQQTNSSSSTSSSSSTFRSSLISINIEVGLVLKEESDMVTIIPLQRISPGSEEFFGYKIPKLEFSMKNVVPIVVSKTSLCRRVLVKRRHYFDNGSLTYYDGMGMYCVDDTTDVISSEYKNLFTLSRLLIVSSDPIDGKLISIYNEKCDIICECRSAISKTKGMDNVRINIPTVSDEIMSVSKRSINYNLMNIIYF